MGKPLMRRGDPIVAAAAMLVSQWLVVPGWTPLAKRKGTQNVSTRMLTGKAIEQNGS